jgi:1-acyl-sn-glycerol-3-phosphate acyltransferase
MLKLFYVIFMNLHRAPYMIPRMRAEADHPQRYTEEQRYSLVQHAIYLMNKTGKINTVETGIENLPKQGGYMMYPNHQGKYDVLGIMYTHKSPCSFVMDKRKSHTILVREFCDLVQAKRLEKDNPRQGITIINQQKRWLPEKSIFFFQRADTGLTIKIRYAISKQEVLRSL